MSFSSGDFWRAIIAGMLIALFSVPVLNNIGLLGFFFAFGNVPIYLFLLAWIIGVPLGAVSGLYLVHRLARWKWPMLYELGKYGLIGWLNVFVNAGVFNSFITITGVANGWLVDGFVITSFFITITQSFFWNKFWIFKTGHTATTAKEYLGYVALTGLTSVINLLLLHILINTIGAPAGIDEKIWANVALAAVIPVSVIGNFTGSKTFVFKKHSSL